MADNEIKKDGVSAQQDYFDYFMPNVHRIGRFTIIVAFFLSILPFCYFYFIKGYNDVSWATLFAGVATVFPMLLGGWISEPLTYWPVLGSAGTYMAYLSGNVAGMRFPVASAVQKNVGADISTPKGQVATIVGIAVSIVMNLVILFITVLVGQAIVAILPPRVLHAFSYCLMGMIGSMVLMRLSMGRGKNVTENIIDTLPYMACGIGAYLLVNFLLTGIKQYGALLGVGCSLLIAWLRYKKAKADWEAKQAK